MLVLNHGRVVYDGRPEDVMTPGVLGHVFGVRCSILTDPETGRPVCLPYKVAARVVGPNGER